MKTRSSARKRGFSPVEIMIVSVILALIVAGLADAYFNFLDRQRMNEAVEGTITIIQKARSLTLSSQDSSAGGSGKRYGVHFDDKNQSAPNRVIIFEGNAYTPPGTPVIDTYSLPAGIVVDLVIYTNLYFERISGSVSTQGASSVPPNCISGCLEMKSQRSGAVKVITVTGTGVIDVL